MFFLQTAFDLIALMFSATAAGAVKPMSPVALEAFTAMGSALATFMMSGA